ncbi:MAG: DUF72 domain-containing protein [Deltaproteobacteria bacterium]|nr:DUF72 domain-containing protein [Deltaproteobacteria bacterium]
MRLPPKIKVGCCGFGASLGEYFRHVKVMEIQDTFYHLPPLAIAKKWRSLAPPGCEYTMKAWQLITHQPISPTYRRLKVKIEPEACVRYGYFQPTREVMAAWEQTAEFAHTLGATIIAFQCSSGFPPTEENQTNLKKFFTRIDREGFDFAWEPRGHWPERIIKELCEELRLIHCVDPFRNAPASDDRRYFRLQGINGYTYRYHDSELRWLRNRASEKPSYVLFNNNSMQQDALRLLQLLDE